MDANRLERMSEVSTKVTTPYATLSFPHLHEAQKGRKSTDKAKYSCALVYAPGTDLSALKAAELAAAEKKYPGKGEEYLRTGRLKSAFRNDAEAKGYPVGSIYQNVRTEQQPGLVYAHAGPDGKPAKVPQDRIREDFYAGAQVRASISFFAYDNEGNRGVSAGLNNIQKVGEGTRLAGARVAAEDDFTALNEAPVDLAGLLG
jgi:hypothetical protein